MIAFIRNGQLWTVDPDGTNAFTAVAQSTPVIGYAWSPNHHILAFRTIDATFAKQDASKGYTGDPSAVLYEDMPSALNTVGVDGGVPIELALSNPTTRYSNMLWNSNSTRLLYAESTTTTASRNWFVSQNDQPVGIALKALPGSYSIPSFSYDTQHYLAIGNSLNGLFTTTVAGTQLHVITSENLPGHPLSDGLERVLWRPQNGDNQFLYALPISAKPPITPYTPLTVQLLLGTSSGQTTPIANCVCSQFAWSPDGNHILTRDLSNPQFHDTLFDLHGHSFTIPVDADSIPYWSSDGHFLLLASQHTLSLVNITTQQQTMMLTTIQPVLHPLDPLATTSGGFSRPVPNNVWAPDSQHFLFLTHTSFRWQHQSNYQRAGLYSVSINATGQTQGDPVLVDAGNDSQPGWSYQDPNTSFLYV